MIASPRIALCVCVLAGGGWLAKAEDRPLAPLAVDQSPIRTDVIRVPWGLFLEAVPGGQPGDERPVEGVRKLPADSGSGDRPRYDVRTFLEKRGIAIPPEGEATYVQGLLVMRARPKDLMLADELVGDIGVKGPANMRHTFTLVEFEADRDASELAGLSPKELRQAAGASWRELLSLSFTVPSGRHSFASSVTGSRPPKSPPERTLPKEKKAAEPGRGPLLAGEYGMRCDVETQVAPDGETCEVGARLYWRAKPGEAGVELESTSLVLARSPAILQIVAGPWGNAAPGQPRRYRAVILNLLRVDLGDLPNRPRK